MPAAARWLRLCTGLTVTGGMLVIAGIATGLTPRAYRNGDPPARTMASVSCAASATHE
jgi:hypothetical protein